MKWTQNGCMLTLNYEMWKYHTWSSSLNGVDGYELDTVVFVEAIRALDVCLILRHSTHMRIQETIVDDVIMYKGCLGLSRYLLKLTMAPISINKPQSVFKNKKKQWHLQYRVQHIKNYNLCFAFTVWWVKIYVIVSNTTTSTTFTKRCMRNNSCWLLQTVKIN